MTNEERAEKLLDELDSSNQGMFSDPRDKTKRDLILAYANEIRQECADKAYKWVVINIGGDDCGNNLDEMDSFIMGKEVGE